MSILLSGAVELYPAEISFSPYTYADTAGLRAVIGQVTHYGEGKFSTGQLLQLIKEVCMGSGGIPPSFSKVFAA